MVSLVIDDIAYVGLGTDENAYTNDWWMYHPGTNTWTQKTDMPGPDRASASTFTIGPRGFVGFGSDGEFLVDLWEYNPWNDSWSIRAPFPGGDRRNAIAFSIGGLGYAGTGKGSAGIRRNFYEYTPLTPTSITENKNENQFSIFPNPAHTTINISCLGKKEFGTWRIFSMNGKLINTNTNWLENFTIDVSAILSGSYFIQIENNGTTFTSKLIITH
jgi:N-acetylneuraminic acid mutarotase